MLQLLSPLSSPPPPPQLQQSAPSAAALAGLVFPLFSVEQATALAAGFGVLPTLIVFALLANKLMGNGVVTWRMLVMLVAGIIDLTTDQLYLVRSTFVNDMCYHACAVFVAMPVLYYLLTFFDEFNHERVWCAFLYFDSTSMGTRHVNWFPAGDLYKDQSTLSARTFTVWLWMSRLLSLPMYAVIVASKKLGALVRGGENAEGQQCPRWARSLDLFVVGSLLLLVEYIATAAVCVVLLLTFTLTMALTLPFILAYYFAVGPLLYRSEVLVVMPLRIAFYMQPRPETMRPLSPQAFHTRHIVMTVLESMPQLVIQSYNSTQLSMLGVEPLSMLSKVSIAFSAITVFSTAWHLTANCCEYGKDFEKWDGITQDEFASPVDAATVLSRLCCAGTTAAAAGGASAASLETP